MSQCEACKQDFKEGDEVVGLDTGIMKPHWDPTWHIQCFPISVSLDINGEVCYNLCMLKNRNPGRTEGADLGRFVGGTNHA